MRHAGFQSFYLGPMLWFWPKFFAENNRNSDFLKQIANMFCEKWSKNRQKVIITLAPGRKSYTKDWLCVTLMCLHMCMHVKLSPGFH
jgi:hypothetical protein